MVAVLEADPELGKDLEGTAFEYARRDALAPLMTLDAGAWDAEPDIPDEPGHLGLLVTEGLLTRSETIGELRYAEFLGAGDILRPWVPGAHEWARAQTSWRVINPARIAVLDHDFALRIRRWPEISAALINRAIMRSRSLGVTLAIHRAVRIQDRVQLMLWHLANRWGHVTPDGTVLPIPLTHDALAELVGARRSPVTVALGDLRSRGLVERGPGRSWLLRGDPISPSPETKAKARSRGPGRDACP